MNQQEIIEELLSLLEGKGVIIRREPLGGSGGGLCVMRDKTIFFVDTTSSSMETAVLCCKALPKLVDLENIYLRPQLREFIEKYYDR